MQRTLGHFGNFSISRRDKVAAWGQRIMFLQRLHRQFDASSRMQLLWTNIDFIIILCNQLLVFLDSLEKYAFVELQTMWIMVRNLKYRRSKKLAFGDLYVQTTVSVGTISSKRIKVGQVALEIWFLKSITVLSVLLSNIEMWS